MLRATRKLRNAYRKLARTPGQHGDNPFPALLRKMNPRNFVYQDVRNVIADVPLSGIVALGDAMERQIAALAGLLAELDAQRDRCGFGG